MASQGQLINTFKSKHKVFDEPIRQGSETCCLGLKEKLSVTFMLCLLATFCALSFSKKHQKFKTIQKSIHIQCLGACLEEKEIELPAGAQVSDLLSRISLTEDADISKLMLHRRLKNGEVFIIPTIGKMTLYVTGAVDKPGLIYTPEGLRYNQLNGYISCTDNADVRIFRRRSRELLEGETIHVPAKSEYIARK